MPKSQIFVEFHVRLLNNIQHDSNVKYLENLFKQPIDEILKNSQEYDNLFNQNEDLKEMNIKYKSCFIIDHIFVYEELIKIKPQINFELSLNTTIEASKIYQNFLDGDYYNPYKLVKGNYNEKIFTDYSSLFYYIITNKYKKNFKDYYRPILNINPAFYTINHSLGSSLNLLLYRKFSDGMQLLTDNSFNYKEYITFYLNCLRYNINFLPNSYGGQNGDSNKKELYNLFEAQLNFLKK